MTTRKYESSFLVVIFNKGIFLIWIFFSCRFRKPEKKIFDKQYCSWYNSSRHEKHIQIRSQLRSQYKRRRKARYALPAWIQGYAGRVCPFVVRRAWILLCLSRWVWYRHLPHIHQSKEGQIMKTALVLLCCLIGLIVFMIKQKEKPVKYILPDSPNSGMYVSSKKFSF